MAGDAQAALEWIVRYEYDGTHRPIAQIFDREHAEAVAAQVPSDEACAVIPAAEYDRLRDRDEALTRVEALANRTPETLPRHLPTISADLLQRTIDGPKPATSSEEPK